MKLKSTSGKNRVSADYTTCIKACQAAAAACRQCAAEDLKILEHDMSRCIKLNMECASICGVAAELMGFGSKAIKDITHICIEICRECAEECSKHAYPHCQACAKACLECAEACSAKA